MFTPHIPSCFFFEYFVIGLCIHLWYCGPSIVGLIPVTALWPFCLVVVDEYEIVFGWEEKLARLERSIKASRHLGPEALVAISILHSCLISLATFTANRGDKMSHADVATPPLILFLICRLRAVMVLLAGHGKGDKGEQGV
jgi:hypothetical protein